MNLKLDDNKASAALARAFLLLASGEAEARPGFIDGADFVVDPPGAETKFPYDIFL
jgi:hypothetical protein